MIDFDSLVLAPAQLVFGHSVTVTPTKSQPGQPAYGGTGIWNVKLTEIMTEDGGVFSNRTISLSVRLSDYPVPPTQGDVITTAASDLPLAYSQGMVLSGNVSFTVDDTNPDGQGAMSLSLKRANT